MLVDANLTRTPISYVVSPTIEVKFSEMAPLLFVSSVTASPFTNIVSLVLKEDTLLPGNPYRFRLEVTNTQERTGFAEIDIFTESRPLAGHLEIQPTQGHALSTKFTLQALQWTDDVGDTPLSYQFGFRYGNGSKYWMTGALTRSRISTLLPQTCGEQSALVLLRIYDQNMAYTEFVSSPRLSSNTSVDLLSAIREIEELSLGDGNWVEGLASLMSLSVCVNRCPDIFTQVPAFKQRALDLLLRLHTSFIPSSRLHLNQLLSLLHETSLQANISETTLVDVTTVIESTVSLYNSFSNTATNVEPGMSQEEAGVVFGTYANLISANSHLDRARVSMDTVTESLLRTSVQLGYGICLQVGISEEPLLLVAEGGTLKASYINLPADYSTTASTSNSPFASTDAIFVDFGRELFWKGLQRPCEGETSGNGIGGSSPSLCSGVCITSVQFRHDLRWQGSEYSSQAKTHFLQLSLLDPQTGLAFNVSDLQSFTAELSFPITLLPSDYDQLACVLWNDTSTAWRTEGCSTTVQV